MKHRVYQHLRCLGYGHVSSTAFAENVERWSEQSGLEWTTERLKRLKASFKDRLETGRYSIPAGWSTRVTREGNTILADNFVHRVLSGPIDSLEKLRKIEGFLRCYTVLKLKMVSQRQEDKMLKAITTPATVSLDVLMQNVREQSLTKLRHLSRKHLVEVRAEEDDAITLPDMLGGATKRSPVFAADNDGTLSYHGSVTRNEPKSANWREYFRFDKATNEFWVTNPEFVARRLFGTNNYPVETPTLFKTMNAPAGTIGVIQDAGCKARWVANPLLAFQALGEPLKAKLLKVCQLTYPEIGTVDQDTGREAVVKWLQEGRKVWSFDATSFTDRFPLILQIDVLNRLREMGAVSDNDIDAFHLIMSKEWIWQSKPSVKWQVGQPLGYGPSFHLATLTHAAIIDNLDSKSTGLWRVVGDDVVIADVALACRYQEFMLLAGVDVNLSKSLISNKYAEFLGKLISSMGVTPSMKVRILIGQDQLQDNLLFYGQSALEHLNLEELGMSARVYLPESLGGLGWRANNVPYSVWLTLTNQESWARNKILKDLRNFTGLRTQLSTNVEAQMQLKVDYFDSNVAPLTAQEWAELGFSEDVNGMTKLPLSTYPENVPSYAPDSKPTLVELIDSEFAFTGDFKTLMPILTPNGYVNHNEKPFNGQSCSYRSSTDVSKQERSRATGGIFRYGVVKRLCREASGETKRELERVLQTSHYFKTNQTTRTERNSNGKV